MDKIVNFELISNPANWIIIFLVLYFAALLTHLVWSSASSAPIKMPVL